MAATKQTRKKRVSKNIDKGQVQVNSVFVVQRKAHHLLLNKTLKMLQKLQKNTESKVLKFMSKVQAAEENLLSVHLATATLMSHS